jgi:hypothetical protein
MALNSDQHKAFPTRKFCTPLKAVDSDTAAQEEERAGASYPARAAPNFHKEAGRPPPNSLTSNINLLNIQIHIREIEKSNFEFRTIRNGIQVVMKKWQLIQP